MLDTIHLINLDRSVDRLANFRQRNPDLEIERFSAIDGAVLDRAQLISDGLITEDCPYPPGTVGCALSHVALWRKGIADGKPITVLEDDTICSFHFHPEMMRILATLPPDWDIIRWGIDLYPTFVWADFGPMKATLHFYGKRYADDYQAFQSTLYWRSAIKLAHAFGTFSYSISPAGARKMLDFCLPFRKRLFPFPGTGVIVDDLGVDASMNAMYTSMQAFICMPPLVIADIQQHSVRTQTDNT